MRGKSPRQARRRRGDCASTSSLSIYSIMNYETSDRALVRPNLSRCPLSPTGSKRKAAANPIGKAPSFHWLVLVIAEPLQTEVQARSRLHRLRLLSSLCCHSVAACCHSVAARERSTYRGRAATSAGLIMCKAPWLCGAGGVTGVPVPTSVAPAISMRRAHHRVNPTQSRSSACGGYMAIASLESCATPRRLSARPGAEATFE